MVEMLILIKLMTLGAFRKLQINEKQILAKSRKVMRMMNRLMKKLRKARKNKKGLLR